MTSSTQQYSLNSGSFRLGMISSRISLLFRNMIDNQVVISEEEKEKIMREHEQNMAELESR